MKNKKFVMVAIPILLILVVIAGYLHQSNQQIETVYAHADFSYDVSNPLEDVGFSDYVFIGKVNKVIETTYLGATEDDPNGIPNTSYSITVIENLKGKLKKNVNVQFTKWGGVSYDGTRISLLEGDQLLEDGKYYILLASAQEDGTLRQTGPYSAIKLTTDSKADVMSSEEFKLYKGYVKDEIKFKRERSKSKYEE